MLGSGSTEEPDYPMALARIQRMSKEELNELLNDDTKFDDYIKSLEQMKRLYSEKEMLMASNKSLAEYNLSQEPILKAKREAMAAKHRQAVDLIAKVKQTKEELENKSSKVTPDTLYYLLQVETEKVEIESEEIGHSFLDGNIDIDQFLTEFLAKRNVMYCRRVKLEKMKELLSNGGPNTPSRRAPPVPGINSATTSNYPYYVQGSISAAPTNNWVSPPPQPSVAAASNLPYPLQPVVMPMPNYR